MILCRTLRDMNLSKFVAWDIPLFLQLLRDIFPKQTDLKVKVHKDLEGAARSLIKGKNLV